VGVALVWWCGLRAYMGGEVGGGLKTSAGVWVTVPQKKKMKKVMNVRTGQKVKVKMKVKVKVGVYQVVAGAWWVR
jgi:hypothetical protein